MEDGLESGEVEELKFKKQLLEQEIPKLNKQASILMEALADPCFADETTPIADAVKKLENIGESANLMKERGKQLNIYQKYLELEDTPFESVNDVFNDWNLKYKLWKGMEEWIALSQEWVGTKFNSIDVENI